MKSKRFLENIAGGAFLAALLASAAGCGSGSEPTSPGGPVASTKDELVGSDGAVVVDMPNTVLNEYVPLAQDAAAGDTSITVTDVTALNSAAFGDLAKGDLDVLGRQPPLSPQCLEDVLQACAQ